MANHFRPEILNSGSAASRSIVTPIGYFLHNHFTRLNFNRPKLPKIGLCSLNYRLINLRHFLLSHSSSSFFVDISLARFSTRSSRLPSSSTLLESASNEVLDFFRYIETSSTTFSPEYSELTYYFEIACESLNLNESRK